MFVYFSCSLVDFVGRSLDMYRVSLYTNLVPGPHPARISLPVRRDTESDLCWGWFWVWDRD